MTITDRKGRGRPFKPGNPGRPPGSKNRITRIAEQVGEERAEQLVEKAVERALAGDATCLRMLLDRFWPVRKGAPIDVAMPPMNSPEDAPAAIAAICKALGEGRLNAEETNALSLVVGRSIQLIELQDFERRIAALVRAHHKRDEKNGNPPA